MKRRTNNRPVVYGGYVNTQKIAARLRAFEEEGHRAVIVADSENAQGP